MQSFVATPILQPGESLRGYIRRLASAMEVATVRDLDFALGESGERLHRQDSNLLGLLFDLPATDIELMRYASDGSDRLRFRGISLPKYFLESGKARVCPECLATGAFHRQIWDLAFVDACPIHGLPLVEHCADCGGTVSWEHRGVLACVGCGATIRRKKASRRRVTYASALLRILSWIGGVEGGEDAHDIPSVMQGVTFTAMIEFVVAMGRIACSQDGIPLAAGRSFVDPNIGKILERGLQVADGWPRSFQELIDRHLGDTPRTGSLTAQLGQFAILANRGSIEWRGIVREALVEALARHTHVSCQPNGDLGKDVLRRRGRCTIKEAQEILAVDQRRFASIRESEAWGKIERDADSAGLLPIEAVQELATAISGVMSMAELGSLIDIKEKEHLRRIANSAIFRKVRNQAHYDQRTRHIQKSDVDDFMATVNAAPAKEVSDFRLMCFKEMVATASQRGIEINRVVEFISERRLIIACKDARPGLPSLFFVKADAIRLFDEIAEAEMGSISVREAAVELMILEREAYQLAKLGFLKTTYVHGKGNLRGQRVRRNDLAEFDGAYVSAKKLAMEYGMDLRVVRKGLRNDLRLVAKERLHQRVEVYVRSVVIANCSFLTN